jgi:hypothetical protein
MSNDSRNYEQELARLMDAMAESVAEMSEEDVALELAEEERDSTEQVRELLRDSIKASKQKPLMEAQARYEKHLAAMERKKHEIPSALSEQRKMIASILAGNPQFGTGLLTAQYRDFTQLPDEDVESYLRQLLELTNKANLLEDDK